MFRIQVVANRTMKSDSVAESDFFNIGTILAIQKVLADVHSENHELEAFETYSARVPSDSNLIQTAVFEGEFVPAKIWAFAFMSCITHWEELDEFAIDNLLLFFEIRNEEIDELNRNTISTSAKILDSVKKIEFSGGSWSPQNACDLAELACQFDDLYAEHAHDILLYSFLSLPPLVHFLEAEPDHLEKLEKLASRYVHLASLGGKKRQIVVADVIHAELAAALAHKNEEMKATAFLAFEIALERLDWAQTDQVNQIIARRLILTAEKEHYLRQAGWGLIRYVEETKLRKLVQSMGLSEIVTTTDNRCHKEADEWIATVISQATLDRTFEDELLKYYKKKSKPAQTNYDWSNWRVNHHSYLHSVPHNKSFFREQDFAINFLAFVHEVTHLLSVSGGIGIAQLTLRSLIVMNEAILSAFDEKKPDVEEDLNIEIKLAGLPNSDALLLPYVARGVDLTLKQRILQDAWTPLLEGIAIFAELDCDPTHDEHGIAQVHRLLRSLVDMTSNFKSKEEYKSAAVKHQQLYEQMASEAIQKLSNRKIKTYFEAKTDIYWCGYIVVRSLVSRWKRMTKGKFKLSHAEAIKLLMESIRYGTLAAIPDFSLPVEEFEAECIALVQRWCVRTAEVDIKSIKICCKTPDREGGRYSSWIPEDDKIRFTLFSEENQNRIQAYIANKQKEFIKSGLGSFSSIVGEASELHSTFESMLNRPPLNTLEKSVEFAEKFIASNSLLQNLLPIGESTSRFYLRFTEGESFGHLFVNLRTTECHNETNAPSYNAMVLPIPADEAKAILGLYERYRTPRMTVRRVVDVGEKFGPAGIGLHFIVFSYGQDGDFVHLVYPSDLTYTQIADDNEREFTHLKRIIKARLENSDAVFLELELAGGQKTADRAIEWIGNSEQWFIGDLEITEIVKTPSERLEFDARNIVDPEVSKSRQNKFARDLLTFALGFDTPSTKARENGFLEWTSRSTNSKLALLKAIDPNGKLNNQEKNILRLHPLKQQDAIILMENGSTDIREFSGGNQWT